MAHPKPVAPAHVSGLARARWVKANKTLSGAPARDARLPGVLTKAKRMSVEKSVQQTLGHNLCRPVNSATGGAPEGFRPPKLPRRLPAVCLATSLGLDPHSPSTHIVHVLRQLRGSTYAPRSLLVHQLKHFDDACLDALLMVLARQPRIFALNIGEATGSLSPAALERLIRHLQSPYGAKIACLYLCDTKTPVWVRNAARVATGLPRRKATEAQARAILATRTASRQALQSARDLVPWRDPRVWRELAEAPLPSDATGTNVRWAMPTWHPKKAWPELA